ncbi:restriction endonuclease subunit S [Cardiobacterium hominis]|uniref:restriction endonuclease subunit S n=1 Tax=Cardiobacterium hominis TaxID=2718 RepID=UPI0028D763AD|nr:restriction endonuclease subunit S [Cardiobacterium hominis]
MNTKQTEIGEIPKDWEVVKLGEVAPLQRGFDLPERQRVDGAYPVVYSNGILNTHNAYKVKAPGVVTGRSGTLGRVHYLEEDFWAHNTTLWVTDFINVEPKFIAYLFQFIGLERFGGGSGVPTLNRNDVHDFQVALPQSKSEQTAIATVLSDTDRLLAALHALIGKKRAIKTAAMQQLLSGSLRLPEFATNGSLKNSELGEIPENWEVVKLGEVAHIKTGSKNNQDKADNGLYPFFVRSETVERINTFSYACEAILVPGEGGIGKIFHYINGKFDAHQRVYVIREFQNTVAKFVYFAMVHSFGVYAMENSVKATVDSLRLPTFKNFQFAAPKSKSEQTAIAQTLSDMDSEIAALEARAAKLAQIKQGLMQNLLTGKIRVNAGAA